MAIAVSALAFCLVGLAAAADERGLLRDSNRDGDIVGPAACVDGSDLTLGGLRLGAPMSDAVAAYGPPDHAGACMTANGGACTNVLWSDLGLNVVADGSGAIANISLGVGDAEQSGISAPADLQIGMTHGEIIDRLGRQPGARNTMKRGYRFPQCRQTTTGAYLELGFDHEDWLNAITIAYDQIL